MLTGGRHDNLTERFVTSLTRKSSGSLAGSHGSRGMTPVVLELGSAVEGHGGEGVVKEKGWWRRRGWKKKGDK